MDGLDKTTRFHNASGGGVGLHVTVFDALQAPYTVTLSAGGKTVMAFGRAEDNDIVLGSHLVSRHHGRIQLVGGKWYIEDLDSTNGLIYNDANIRRKELGDGDFIRIDDGVETVTNGVLFVFSSAQSTSKWTQLPITGQQTISIGRDSRNTITLPHISVSKQHALITLEGGKYYIADCGSANGLFINGNRLYQKTQLHEKDVITITNSKLIFTSAAISYCYYKSGISVDASNVVIKRGKGSKSFVTCNHVNLNIKPGELVAIIGGSGAGKSTLLNAMCGYLTPAEGNVYINGIDMYENFDSLKKLVGYVPQQDIVYDNLSLYDMLLYTAKMRLPKDISEQEREAAITRAINMVELSHKRDALIKALSGGQRKRASIAVELLSDPNLLYLDEPSSGLDPGTERNLMKSLREMADSGKTVILVTHSTLQLQLCDKVVFMGAGGNLCFCGSMDEALAFFHVDNVVDVYNMITSQAKEWSARFAQVSPPLGVSRKAAKAPAKPVEDHKHQLRVLCSRYTKLVTNDKARLLLLMLQAPLLGFLVTMVATADVFSKIEITKALMFALSCCAFWVGMLNAIQEICKERNILKREYMTGLSLGSYIKSKIIVLGTMCFIQCALLVGVFFIGVGGKLQHSVMLPPVIEIFVTVYLTALSAAALGLFVSSLFDNADKAMVVAPILLMPQILFSGQLFVLDGATEIISYFATCRWSMEGLGSTANLNDLPSATVESFARAYASDYGYSSASIPEEMMMFDPSDFYLTTSEHMLTVWGILLASVVIFLVLAQLNLKKLKKQQ